MGLTSNLPSRTAAALLASLILASLSLVPNSAAASSAEPSLAKDINFNTLGLASDDGRDVAVLNGIAYFFAKSALWKTDGTVEGTVEVKALDSISRQFQKDLVVHNNELFFAASDGIHGTELWKSDGTASGTVMVKDIAVGAGESYPSLFTSVGNTLFFRATDATNGAELWKTDGTEVGTVLVKDVFPGATGGLANNGDSTLAAFDSTKLIFQGQDSAGRELWISDGTEVGTTRVKDINSGASNSIPTSFTKLGSLVYFTATTAAEGTELWKTDGTEGGTALAGAGEIRAGASNSNPTFLTVFESDLYFKADDGSVGEELWKVEGDNGTVSRVTNKFSSFADPPGIIVFNSKLYFSATGSDGVAGNEVWESDGTDSGTVLFKDVRAGSDGSSPAEYVVAGSLFFFSAETDLEGRELWVSDGTSAGTRLTAEVVPGPSGGWSSYPDPVIAAFGSSVLFTATTNSLGIEMWISDGSASGTKLLKDINTVTADAFSSSAELVALDDLVIFEAQDQLSNLEIWASDGTSTGTQLLKEIREGTSSGSIESLTRVGDKVFFIASNGTNSGQSPAQVGSELWVTDGTPSGTNLVKDIRPGTSGSNPGRLRAAGNLLYFQANDGVNGTELWKSDGTEAGTVLVKDITPRSSSSSFGNAVAIGSTIYFPADDGTNGRELWRSDGTEAGTQLVKNINPSSDSSPSGLTVIGSTIYFAANDGTNGWELWKSDGTEAGTQMVLNIGPTTADGLSDSVSDNGLTAVGDVLFFTPNDGNGRELWKSDGTAAGTVKVKDLNGNPATTSDPYYLTALGDSVVFSAQDSSSDREPWISDGTEAGTVRLKNIRSGSSSDPTGFKVAGDDIYFFATTDEHGKELWRSDGTEAGTQLVYDLSPGATSSHPGYDRIAVTRDRVFFVASDGSTGYELWSITYEGGSPATPGGPVSVSRPYEGPLDLKAQTGPLCSGLDAILTGQRLNTIEQVQVGEKVTAFRLLENGNLSYSLKDIAPGTYQLRLSVPVSSVFLTSQITVQACSSQPVGSGQVGKVNVGSFNGKLVVYAAGLEGKRISWKVGGKWGRQVATSSFARFDRPTPRKGVTVNVQIFIDGVPALTRSVLTR